MKVNTELSLGCSNSETNTASSSHSDSTLSLKMQPAVTHSKKVRWFGVDHDMIVPDEGEEKENQASSSETLSNSTTSESSGESQCVADVQTLQLHELMRIGDDNLRKGKRKIGECLQDSTGSTDDHLGKAKKQKGTKWSEQEHQDFLRGMEEFGKGNWKEIAKKYVPTRTNMQVATHAQKHFKRLASEKKRSSIFDAPLQKPNVEGESTVLHRPVPLQMIDVNSLPPRKISGNENENLHHQTSQLNPMSRRASPPVAWVSRPHPHRSVMIYVPCGRFAVLPYGSWQAHNQFHQLPSSMTSDSSGFQETQSCDDPAEDYSSQSSPRLPFEFL